MATIFLFGIIFCIIAFLSLRVLPIGIRSLLSAITCQLGLAFGALIAVYVTPRVFNGREYEVESELTIIGGDIYDYDILDLHKLHDIHLVVRTTNGEKEAYYIPSNSEIRIVSQQEPILVVCTKAMKYNEYPWAKYFTMMPLNEKSYYALQIPMGFETKYR